MTILRKKQIRILRKKSESKEKVYILREKSPNSLIQVRILRCISEFCISENLETHVVFIKKQTKKKSQISEVKRHKSLIKVSFGKRSEEVTRFCKTNQIF